MKNLYLLLFIPLLFSSCSDFFSSSLRGSTRFYNKEIAILPFEIHTSVKHLPDGVTIAMLVKSERQKGQLMQRDLYRYLIRELAVSKRRVRLQDVNQTNKVFQELGMDYEKIFNTPKKELANMLGVDAIIFGSIYQYRNKLRMDGTDRIRYAGANNKISTILTVYDNKQGRLQWKYDKSQSGFPSEVGPDVVKGLLRKAAREFPL